MKKITSKEKIRRASTIASAVLILYLIAPVVTLTFSAVTGFMDGWNSASSGEQPSPTMPNSFFTGTLYIIAGAAFFILIIVAVVSSLQLLMSIRKDESPFTENNGKKIRTIGIALILIEPADIALTFIQSGGVSAGSGLIFSVGIVMYCISLVFRYGCELQQESDETL